MVFKGGAGYGNKYLIASQIIKDQYGTNALEKGFVYTINLLTQIKLLQKIYLEAALGYAIKRYDLKYNTGVNSNTSSYRIFQFPVTVFYHLGKEVALGLGPEYTYFFSRKIGDVIIKTPIWPENNRWSGTIQLQYNFNSQILLSLKYNHSIEADKINYTDQNGVSIGQAKLYDQYAQLMLKYLLF